VAVSLATLAAGYLGLAALRRQLLVRVPLAPALAPVTPAAPARAPTAGREQALVALELVLVQVALPLTLALA
jgi:hypothetical protein